jgi:hypothetical protein
MQIDTRSDVMPAKVKVKRQSAYRLHSGEMLFRTYYLDVKDTVNLLNRFEVRFVRDDEAIRYSKVLAANFRRRKIYHLGLMITVLDQVSRKIHEEVVYPEDEHRT